MNFKTTAALVIVLAVVLGWFAFERPFEESAEPERDVPASLFTMAQQDLFKDAPEVEDIVAVEARLPGQDPWRFERGEGDDSAKWRMVAPFEADVTSWEAENIARTILGLKYQIKYEANEPDAVTPEQAGLTEPRCAITVDTKGGETLAVHVGRTAGNNATYVRLPDADTIYVAQRALDQLVKKSATEYRDKKLFDLQAPEAVAVEVLHRPEDGEHVTYRLVKRDEGDWVFEEPFDADADDKTISDLISSAARLRATEWVDHDPKQGLGVFGLSSPLVDVEITTERKVVTGETEDESSESDESGDAAPEETIETNQYRFTASSRSPLGKETSVYLQPGDHGVALVSRTMADKFTPVMDQWRNMKIVSADANEAIEVQLNVQGEPPVTLALDAAGDWVFSDGAKAEKSEIRDLLKAINELKAVSFEDRADADDAQYGLTDPRAEILLTLAGSDTPERLTLGGPTDAVARRLYYLRRAESTSIAKIRATDADVLTRDPLLYLNRQINQFGTNAIESIGVTRPNPVTGDEETIALEKVGGGWRMTSPVEASADTATAVKLVATFTKLAAESVVARNSAETPYDFDNPTVTVSAEYKGTPLIQTDPDAEGPAPPTTETVELRIVESNGDVFAKRGDRPTVYQLRTNDYQTTRAEFRAKGVIAFEQSQATAVAVTTDGVTHRFEKGAEGWVYGPEPDLPIDPKKVENLLVQLADMKLSRYVAYGAANLPMYGLDDPDRIVRVETDEDRTITLFVSGNVCPQDEQNGVYAMLEGSNDVFLLAPDMVSRIAVSLDDFERAPGT